jgi:hypothetical protein
MKNNRVYLLQVGLKSLGFDPGSLDGIEGSNTNSAFDAWLSSLTKPTASRESNAAALVRVAQTQLGIRETSKNHGPGIEKFWGATTYLDGYANREPYCAAFVCWCVLETVAGKTFTFSLPKSPVAYDFEKWGVANASKGVSVLSNSSTPKAGDIFTLETASHVGIVKAVNGLTVVTIEGNTDGSGNREGDGVYEKIRRIATIRKLVRINS